MQNKNHNCCVKWQIIVIMYSVAMKINNESRADIKK